MRSFRWNLPVARKKHRKLHMSVIPDSRRLRQIDCKFKSCLGKLMKPCLKTQGGEGAQGEAVGSVPSEAGREGRREGGREGESENVRIPRRKTQKPHQQGGRRHEKTPPHRRLHFRPPASSTVRGLIPWCSRCIVSSPVNGIPLFWEVKWGYTCFMRQLSALHCIEKYL